MIWLIIRTEPTKEFSVARQVAVQGYGTFLPLEIRSHSVSRHTRRRVITEIPLCPRICFTYIPQELQDQLTRLRYVTGLARNAQGGVFIIPEPQMAKVQECHQEWLQSQIKAHSMGTPNKNKKAKWRPIEALREFFGQEIEETT